MNQLSEALDQIRDLKLNNLFAPLVSNLESLTAQPDLNFSLSDRGNTAFTSQVVANNTNARINGVHLVGSVGNDTLVGLSGNDQLIGKDGNDWLYGSFGDDSLYIAVIQLKIIELKRNFCALSAGILMMQT